VTVVERGREKGRKGRIITKGDKRTVVSKKGGRARESFIVGGTHAPQKI